jgi:prefoldin alpha subunit
MKQEEILANARLYSQQRQLVERELEKLMYSLIELNNSVTTIRDMKSESGLVPIGGGAFVKAKMEGDKVLVPIGAGYHSEYPLKDAGEEVSRRVVLTERAISKLREEMGKIDHEMSHLEEEYRKLKG